LKKIKIMMTLNKEMSIFQPYLFNPRGDGVRAPIRQAPLTSKRENLTEALASKYFHKQGKYKKIFQSQIKPILKQSDFTRPSWSATYGRGRQHRVKQNGGDLHSVMVKSTVPSLIRNNMKVLPVAPRGFSLGKIRLERNLLS
jgi:hypothetical protein